MKVSLDQSSANKNVDRAITAYRNTQTARMDNRTGEHALDISGIVMDNNAYTGHGKTAEEVMQDAGQIDVATQRDYMTVMSNTMSEEDFSRLQEEGGQPGDMEIEEVVTIVDTIKAELLKGGTQVAGYTDDLDADTLREITGSDTFAQELLRQFAKYDIPVTRENVTAVKQAYDQAAGLETPDDGTVKYMIENQMDPTIDNLYRAGYSSYADSNAQGRGYYREEGSAYYAKKAEQYDWEQIREQMEKVIDQAGLSVDEDTMEEAKWLIESGIPLTGETLLALHAIRGLELPQDREQVIQAAAAAIADGKSAGEANLADPRSGLQKAQEYTEILSTIEEETVDQAVQDGKELTIENLARIQQERESGDAGQEGQASAEETYTPEQITARRKLEEARLKLTVEANLKLLRSGISIDTTELSRLVDALKEMEEAQTRTRWGDTEDAKSRESLLQETKQKLAALPYLPAAVIGRYVTEEELFTIGRVYDDGCALRDSYEAARQSYETLMTAPRADMGDSIRKAFRNVDDILQDMGLEASEENRRAVRILGYNSIEITQDNVDVVKKYDLELRETIRKMTPQATLQAIRDGVNPLTMSMEELNAYLDSTQQAADEKEEKFSKFLYKLEQNKEILPEERESYIGIFRMFRQLEKTDDAAVGSLMKQGSELSFENLLTAMRSTRKKGMDYAVDDSFGGVDGVRQGKSITEQIKAGFGAYERSLAGQIADAMEPEMLQNMELSPDMTLEQFAEQMQQAQKDEELESSYRRESMQEMQNVSEVEDAVIRELLDYGQRMTPNNLTAAQQLRSKGAELYKKLNDLAKSADKEEWKEKASELIENLDGEEETQAAYEQMQQSMQELVDGAKEQATGYLDLKALQSVNRQLSLAGDLAREENYQIPVEIDGELTAINLKILHGREGGKVSASLETEKFGHVAAHFAVRGESVSGYVVCDSPEGAAALEQKIGPLKEQMAAELSQDASGKETTVGDVRVIYSRENRDEGYEKEDLDTDPQIETADLYRIAKSFIKTVAR